MRIEPMIRVLLVAVVVSGLSTPASGQMDSLRPASDTDTSVHASTLLVDSADTSGPPIDSVQATATAEVEELILDPMEWEDGMVESAGDGGEVDTLAGAEDAMPEIEKMPELVTFVEAEYPPRVYRQGVEGTVLMDLLVSDSGTVDSVAIVRGLHPVLDTSAVAAAMKFVFTPALVEGQAVPVLLQYEYRFSLREVVEKVEEYVNFKGRLVERGTRSPLADAMVVVFFKDTSADTSLGVPFSLYLERIGRFEGQYLEEDRLVSLTDSLGYFAFRSLPVGEIEVSAPLAGYEQLEETERIEPNEELTVGYTVRKISYSDYEIVVYGKAEEKEVSRRQLTLNEVKKIPGLGGDAVKVVQALPGVARATFGGPEIIVRGASTADSRYFLDGIEIPLLFHFGGLKSTYNSDALESVDFYPGGFGTRYGNAVAGVVEITGRRPKTDRWHGYIDANFTDGSVLVEGPLGSRLSVLAAGRRSFIGDLIKLAVKQYPSSPVMTVAPYYWDYQVRTDLDINEANHAYLTAFGVLDGSEVIISGIRGGSSEIQDDQSSFGMEILFHMGILGWDLSLGEKWKNQLRYSFLYGRSEVNVFGFMGVENLYWQHYLRDQLTFSPNEKIKWNIGVDVNAQPLDLILKIPAGDNTIQKDTTSDWWFGGIGGYTNLEIRPVENLQIIPGLRYEFYPELDYTGTWLPEFWDYNMDNNDTRFSGEPSARLNARYEFVENHTVKGALGTYSQSPEPMGQTVHETWGDPKLEATRAAQYVLGYEWQITDLIHVDVQGYTNRHWDRAREATAYEQQTLKQEPFIDDGERKMKGLEVMLRHDQGDHFFGWISYSLSRSETWDHEENRWQLFSKDQTHNLIAVGNLRLPKNWEAGFRFQYTTGDPATPVTGSVYYEKYHAYGAEMGPTNSIRLPPHAQLDLRVDKKFVFKKWMLAAYVDFFNIGYFLYKSPQMYMSNWDPYDYKKKEWVRSPVYQYSLMSVGLKAEF